MSVKKGQLDSSLNIKKTTDEEVEWRLCIRIRRGQLDKRYYM